MHGLSRVEDYVIVPVESDPSYISQSYPPEASLWDRFMGSFSDSFHPYHGLIHHIAREVVGVCLSIKNDGACVLEIAGIFDLPKRSGTTSLLRLFRRQLAAAGKVKNEIRIGGLVGGQESELRQILAGSGVISSDQFAGVDFLLVGECRSYDYMTGTLGIRFVLWDVARSAIVWEASYLEKPSGGVKALGSDPPGTSDPPPPKP